jgi:hypothetical protein
MENDGVEIESVLFELQNMIINYVNGANESLPIGLDTYKAFHQKWLIPNPPFISDSYKIPMRNIILAAINNNPKCIAELNKFFSPDNQDTVKKFFTYMRSRDATLPAKKVAWTVKTP